MPVRDPKLTYRQFLAKNPVNPVAGRTGKQRYSAYENAYLKQNKPPRQQLAGNPVPTLNSLLARVGQFETPAQLEARANRMANQGIAAQQKIIREEAKMMRDEALQRMQAQAAAGRAAAQLNAGLFGMVGGEYNAAANEIRGLATNLSSGQAQAMNEQVAQQNAGLGAVGAPGMAVGGPAGAPGIAGPTQAGVEAYRGGTLPAQALGTAGQAATFGLAGMVSAQNLRATQEAQAAFGQSVRDANKARVSALKELAAGRPAQAAQFLQQLQDAQRQQIGLASGLIQQRAAMRQAGFEQGMTKKEFTQTVKQQTIENKLAKQAAQIDYGQVDPAKSFALGYIVDKRGKPVLDKNGDKIPAKRLLLAEGGGKGGGRTASLTPGQRVELLEKAQTYVENSFYGYKVVDGKRVPASQAPDFDPNDPSTWGTGAQQYKTALSRLQNMGLGSAEAQSILDTYYERGDSGRPIFNAGELAAMRQAYGANRLGWLVTRVNSLYRTGQAGAADALVQRALSGGQGIDWPKKWQLTLKG